MTNIFPRILQFLAAMMLSLVSSSAFAAYLGTFDHKTYAQDAIRAVWSGNVYDGQKCPAGAPAGFLCITDYNSNYFAGYKTTGGCPDGEVPNAAHKCLPPPDPCKEKENTSAGSFTVPGSSSPSGGYCFNGCSIGMIGNGVLNQNGSKSYSDSIYLGSKCTVGAGTGSAGEDYWDPTADPTKPPPGSGGGGETGTCSNGGTDYPTCTPPTGTCVNGGTNYPTCTPPTGTCSNGGTNYPTCTPPVGTCSNGGTDYPTCTAPGSGGTGNGSGQAVCGGPGLPACAVNINESGPGNVVVEGNRSSDDFNRAVDARIVGFSNETRLVQVPWSLTFSLPASTCRPLEWVVLGTVRTFDPCPLFQRVRDGLAYLLYGLCAIYLWKRLTNAQGST